MPVNSASDAVWVLMETTSGCIGPPSPSLLCQEMALVNQNQNQNPPDQSDFRGKKRNLQLATSGRAILSTHFWVPDTPPLPPF